MGIHNGQPHPQSKQKRSNNRKRAFFQPHQSLVLAAIPALLGMLIARPGLLAMHSKSASQPGRFSMLRMGSQAYGSINNFDAVNDTGVECHGFEIEIDGAYSKDITYTYDYNHYGTPKISEDLTDPLNPKVFVRYESGKNPDGSWKAYTAIPSGPILPTDGHQFVNPNINFGGEHFGVGFYGAPKGIKYSWLKDDGAGNLTFAGAVAVATPTFNYAPPINNAPAQVQAVIVPPPPPKPVLEFGPASWVKETRTSTHNNGKVELKDLVSDDPDNPNDRNWKNGEPDEVEVEWQIFQKDFKKVDGGANGKIEGAPEDLNNGDEVITRRYDFFEYVGPIDPETGEALCESVGPDGIHGTGTATINGVDVDLSTVVVVGDYIGAQMAAFDAEGKLGLIDHLQDADIDEAYPDRSIVIGGPNPVQITQTGALPDGMYFDEVTGVLSGTPRTAGTFNITVNAVDTIGGNVTKTFALKVNGPNAGQAILAGVSLDRSIAVSGYKRLVTVSLAAAAPTATIVSLSADTSDVDVPATVTIEAGQTSVTTQIATHPVRSLTTLQVSAALGAQLVSTPLTLLPPMPKLRLAPPSTYGGNSVKGTVILSGPAPTGGLEVLLESDDPAVTVPVSITIAQGQRTAEFTVQTSPVTDEIYAYITASLDEVSTDASLTVRPKPIIPTSISLPESVIGGSTASGVVELSATAPVGGVSVELSSSSATVTVPVSVTIPAGQKSAGFTFSSGVVTSDTSVKVTARANGGSATANTLIKVRPLGVLVAQPSDVAGNSIGSATLTLSAPASSAITVNVASNNAALIPAAKTITIAKGATSGVVKFSTLLVTSDTSVRLSCTSGGLEAATTIRVLAARPQSITVLPGTVIGGKSAVATVSLSSVAPVGGQVVTLSSGDASAQVPASITIPAGKSTASFTVTTSAVQASRDASITATCNGASSTATLRVAILTVSSVVFTPSSVDGGAKANGLITLTGPAPAGGAVVTLRSDKASVVVPASITVPAGKTSAAIAVTTAVVGDRVDAEVKAKLGGEEVDGVLSVMPPTIAAFTVTPTSIKGGGAVTGLVKLGKAVSVPVVVKLTSGVPATVSVPETVTIPAGVISATFNVTTVAVPANKTVAVTAKTGITAKSVNVVITK